MLLPLQTKEITKIRKQNSEVEGDDFFFYIRGTSIHLVVQGDDFTGRITHIYTCTVDTYTHLCTLNESKNNKPFIPTTSEQTIYITYLFPQSSHSFEPPLFYFYFFQEYGGLSLSLLLQIAKKPHPTQGEISWIKVGSHKSSNNEIKVLNDVNGFSNYLAFCIQLQSQFLIHKSSA